MDDRFENKLIGYVYETRFIASWARAGGDLKVLRGPRGFEAWLRSIGELSEDQIDHLLFLAENGRLELETHAEKFINEHKES